MPSISWTAGGATFTVNMPTAPSVVYATSDSVSLTIPNVQLKMKSSELGSYVARIGLGYLWDTQSKSWVERLGLGVLKNKQLQFFVGARGTTQVKSNVYTNATWNKNQFNIRTSQIFNSENPTTRIVNYEIAAQELVTLGSAVTAKDDYYDQAYPNADKTLATIPIHLDVPPTFNNGTLEFDTDYDAPYESLTTASIDIDSLEAYYGGYITKAELKIGTQTAELTGDAQNVLVGGTLSILLNSVGTFTPTITVTDSRLQTAVHELEPITVLAYDEPTINISKAGRCIPTESVQTPIGKDEDEGIYALLVSEFSFTSDVTDLDEPIVVGAANVTWYIDRNANTGEVSNPVDWSDTSSLSSPITLYGLVGTLQTDQAYNISVSPKDKIGNIGIEQSVSIPIAFYTVDYKAGGHGIAFGQTSNEDGFFCNMDAHFLQQFHAKSMIGFVQMFAGQTAPNGWLLCQGQELLIADYQDLYDVIGNTYGTASDTDHFVLPDMRDRFPVGAGSTYSLNDKAGTTTHTHTTKDFTLKATHIPAHTHGKETLTGAINLRQANGPTAFGTASGIVKRTAGSSSWTNAKLDGSSNTFHTFTIDASHTHTSVGGDSAHNHGSTNSGNNLPPYIGINYIIYAGV